MAGCPLDRAYSVAFIDGCGASVSPGAVYQPFGRAPSNVVWSRLARGIRPVRHSPAGARG